MSKPLNFFEDMQVSWYDGNIGVRRKVVAGEAEEANMTYMMEGFKFMNAVSG